MSGEWKLAGQNLYMRRLYDTGDFSKAYPSRGAQTTALATVIAAVMVWVNGLPQVLAQANTDALARRIARIEADAAELERKAADLRRYATTLRAEADRLGSTRRPRHGEPPIRPSSSASRSER